MSHELGFHLEQIQKEETHEEQKESDRDKFEVINIASDAEMVDISSGDMDDMDYGDTCGVQSLKTEKAHFCGSDNPVHLLHAQALTLAALAGAAVVEYYDHQSGAKTERYAKFLPPIDTHAHKD